MERLETDAPDEHRAFCQWEEKDRIFWRSGPFAAKGFAQRRVAVYDEPEQRQKRFQEYLIGLAKDKQPLPSGALAFWAWDKQLNPERFQE